MEIVESKIINIFLLLRLIFILLADYCVTFMQHVFIINTREEAAIYRTWRTRAKKRLCEMFYDIGESGASTH